MSENTCSNCGAYLINGRCDWSDFEEVPSMKRTTHTWRVDFADDYHLAVVGDQRDLSRYLRVAYDHGHTRVERARRDDVPVGLLFDCHSCGVTVTEQ
jgi:hypothetical protein